VNHWRYLIATAAAYDHPFRSAPRGEAGRITVTAAVMRREQHVTIVRQFGN
jgi:hypothetical protein